MKLSICILIAATFALPSMFRHINERGFKSAEAISTASPAAIEYLLQAHGGRDAIAAINSYRIEMTKIVKTVPPKFFARKVRLSLEGNKIRRETTDPRGERTRVELIDENGRFHSAMMVRYETSALSSAYLSEDAQRQSIVRANVDVSSLIPFLKSFSDSAASAYYLGREHGDMDKYMVENAGRQFIVFLDQNGLISRVEIGRNRFEFADFKPVGSLRLPFVERIYIGDRQVFEFYISEFEINPTFDYQYFSRAGSEQ